MLSTVYDHFTIKTMTTHTTEIINGSDMHNGAVVEEDGAGSISVNPSLWMLLLWKTTLTMCLCTCSYL